MYDTILTIVSVFSSQDIALIMQGLGNMNTEYLEVVEVVEVIRTKIKACAEAFDINIVTTCLQSLRNMDNDKEIVKLTIDDILAKVTHSDNDETDKYSNAQDYGAEVIIVNKGDAEKYGVQSVNSNANNSSCKSGSTNGGKGKGKR
jgi:hypothetical protein